HEACWQVVCGRSAPQSQLRGKPPQLKRSLFQLSMTSTEGLFSLPLQGPISFFVAACLENFLSAATFSNIHVKPGEPDDFAVGIVVSLAATFYPQHCSVGSHDAERVIPPVPCLAV